MPFSHDAFLDVFGDYNSRLWPLVAGLWVLTGALVLRWMRQGRVSGRGPLVLLAIHWAWSGLVYHFAFFRAINPAAGIFAAGFLIQACLFVWFATKPAVTLAIGSDRRGILGGALIAYGLAYPIAGFAFGLSYPRMPLFAVPCPTTFVTAGVLIVATGLPRMMNVLPALWALIGSSAAVALGIYADMPLLFAAILLVLDMAMPPLLGMRYGKKPIRDQLQAS